jgi:hypothetical protein
MFYVLDEYNIITWHELTGKGLYTGGSRVIPFKKPLYKKHDYSPVSFPANICYDAVYGHAICNPIKQSIIILPIESILSLTSVVAREYGKVNTFTLFAKYGLKIALNKGFSYSAVGNNQESIQENMSVAILEGHDWGCLQLRCVNPTLEYNKCRYGADSLFTFYFYKNTFVIDEVPYPPIVTVIHLDDQNYVPLLPGQVVQVVAPEKSVVEGNNKSVLFCEKSAIGKNLRCYRYECLHPLTQPEHLCVSKDPATDCNVIFPVIDVDKEEASILISEPKGVIRVICYNINSMRVKFDKNIPKAIQYNSESMELRDVNYKLKEIKILLKKPMRGVRLICAENRIEIVNYS